MVGIRDDKKNTGNKHTVIKDGTHSYRLAGTLNAMELAGYNAQELFSFSPLSNNSNKIVLGKGNFGTVRIAIKDGTYVAVKKTKQTSADIAVFANETQIHEKILKNNIKGTMVPSATIKSVNSKGENTLYQFMPLASHGDGGRLFERIGTKNISTVEILTISLTQIFSALHQHGIYHRDLKPDNLLLDKNNVLYVADWGSAIVFENGQTIVQVYPKGHQGYSPPEEMYGESIPDELKALSAEQKATLLDAWRLGLTLVSYLGDRCHYNVADLAHLVLTNKKTYSERLGLYKGYLETITDDVYASKLPETVKEVISGLLRLDYNKRLTVTEAARLIAQDDTLHPKTLNEIICTADNEKAQRNTFNFFKPAKVVNSHDIDPYNESAITNLNLNSTY